MELTIKSQLDDQTALERNLRTEKPQISRNTIYSILISYEPAKDDGMCK